ncbi:hypothetical protein MTO96_012432 [Rhipicephalus appendiculatus]
MERFWEDNLDPETIALYNIGRGSKDEEDELFNLNYEVGTRSIEGQRVLRIALIFHNLSFEERNAVILSKNRTFIRFVMLSALSRWSTLRQVALDTIGNLAAKLVLYPALDEDEDEASSGHHCYEDLAGGAAALVLLAAAADPRGHPVAGPVPGRPLPRHPGPSLPAGAQRRAPAGRAGHAPVPACLRAPHRARPDAPNLRARGALHAQRAWSRRVRAHASRPPVHGDPGQPPDTGPFGLRTARPEGHEAHRDHRSTPASATSPGGNKQPGRHSDLVADVGAVDAFHGLHWRQSGSDERTGERRRAWTGTTGPRTGVGPPAAGTPAAAATGLATTAAPQSDPMDTEAFAGTWVRAMYEPAPPGCMVARNDIYAEYVTFCSKAGRKSVISASVFSNCVKAVYTQTGLRRVDGANGVVSFHHDGLRKRLNPLPVPIQVTSCLSISTQAAATTLRTPLASGGTASSHSPILKAQLSAPLRALTPPGNQVSPPPSPATTAPPVVGTPPAPPPPGGAPPGGSSNLIKSLLANKVRWFCSLVRLGPLGGCCNTVR